MFDKGYCCPDCVRKNNDKSLKPALYVRIKNDNPSKSGKVVYSFKFSGFVECPIHGVKKAISKTMVKV